MEHRNESEQTINFLKSFFRKVIALKYIYISTVVLFLSAMYFYNKYSPRVYELNSTIGPLKDTRNSVLASGTMFRDGSSSSPATELESAINSLNSFDLVAKTVNNLNLEIGYFESSKRIFKQYTELYLQAPFIVTLDKSHLQSLGARFYVSVLNSTSYRISISSGKTLLYNYIDNNIVAEDVPVIFDTICKFNETINNKYFRLSIAPNPQYLWGSSLSSKYDYYFELYHPDALTNAYLKSLGVEPISVLASIIKIKFSSTNLQKSLDFLNSYVNLFLEENLEKKNKIANNTINFINTQLAELSDSLDKSESNLNNFKSNNQVMDLSYQGQQVYGQLSQIENQKSNLEQQKQYYNYILNYFKTNQDVVGVTPPSFSNITDPILTNLLSDITTLISEKSTIVNNSEKNLFSAQIEIKIKAQKEAIIENLTNSLNTLNLALNELNYKQTKLKNEISTIPKKEMNMVNIQRNFNLNNSIYTYLLQKKAESAITLSSNYPDYEVIEPARAITAKQIKPKGSLNYLIAIFFAFLFPTGYIILRDFFNDKITNVDFPERLLNRSVLGVIHSNSYSTEAVVKEYPHSSIAESFRNIRSSLFFKLKNKPFKIILISSSQPRDGKSFVSFNLATSIASVGYKTIILDGDLHKPTLHYRLKMENSAGLSNYMIKQAEPKDIIRSTSTENLSFISAGPLLANPSELIEAGALDELINQLKKNYDYIIIDSTPVGIVADAIVMTKYASQILLVCRNNYTHKDTFSKVVDTFLNNNLDSFDIIFNDQKLKETPYGHYASYYKKD